MGVTADDEIDQRALGRHYPVHVQAAVAQNDDNIDPLGFQSVRLLVHRFHLVQKL